MYTKEWKDFQTRKGIVFKMFDVSENYPKAQTPDGKPANFMVEVFRVIEPMRVEDRFYHMERLGYIGLSTEDLNNLRDITEQINSGLVKLLK